MSPQMYPYFDIAIGFVWSNDTESYVGGNVATSTASHVVRSKVMTQTKRDALVLYVGCWAWGYQHHPTKYMLFRSFENI